MTAASRPSTELKPVFQQLTPERMDDLGTVLRGNFGAGCWCMYPRLTGAQTRQLPGEGTVSPRKREAMTHLAARDPALGLLAYAGDEPIGWIAIAPRGELTRLSRSRATPPVDAAPVWVIPMHHRPQRLSRTRHSPSPDPSRRNLRRQPRRPGGRGIPPSQRRAHQR